MELRVLRYFIEVARERSITNAARHLHISQPTLSKQLKDLESELGVKLFLRLNYSIKLTEEGILLKKRAEDILEMADKTLDEFTHINEITGGDIRIGCAESYNIKYLTDIIKDFKDEYKGLRIHITSGDTKQVTEQLERGLSDFAVIVEPPDLSKYNYLSLPQKDTWGLLMRRDSPLATKKEITFNDLKKLDLISSAQSLKVDIPRWCGEKMDDLNIIGTVNLFYNGAICVRSGLGSMLTFDKLATIDNDSELCFSPLTPPLQTQMYIIWKKYQVFTPITQKLIDILKECFNNNS